MLERERSDNPGSIAAIASVIIPRGGRSLRTVTISGRRATAGLHHAPNHARRSRPYGSRALSLRPDKRNPAAYETIACRALRSAPLAANASEAT